MARGIIGRVLQISLVAAALACGSQDEGADPNPWTWERFGFAL